MTDSKYKFSFVMPVYNVAALLPETVDSILAQTLDFAANCEIVFVNDGSPDNSEAVCLGYQKRFPENIKYVKQENAGPGAARNRGIALAEGKYISLLDSDDVISSDTLKEVFDFFEAHQDDVDIVSLKQEFFEARTGPHPLNYKFTGDRVIDLTADFDQIQMSAPSSFFKASMLQAHPFEPSIGRYAEDSMLMAELLLDNPKFGVVTAPTYFYRKRRDAVSSLDTAVTDAFWYLETPKRAWASLFATAEKRQGTLPKYIQYMVMYDLQWRFKQVKQSALTPSELEQYKQLLVDLLQSIDDDVIMTQRQISIEQKLFILRRKYGEAEFDDHVVSRDGQLYVGETPLADPYAAGPLLHVDVLSVAADKLILEGHLGGYVSADHAQLCFEANGEIHHASVVDRPHAQSMFLGESLGRHHFKVSLPASDKTAVTPQYVVGGKAHALAIKTITTYRFTGLSSRNRDTYRLAGGWIIKKRPHTVRVHANSWLRRLAHEARYKVASAKRLTRMSSR